MITRLIWTAALVAAAIALINSAADEPGDADARGPARTVTSWPWE
jgi:hypothetical protein